MSEIKSIKDNIRQIVREESSKAWDVAVQLHKNPELGHEEYYACDVLTEYLEEQGFDVNKGLADMDTSFLARWDHGDGPTVAILAEYDALPELGHACGHNIIGAAAILAGCALKKAIERTDLDSVGTVEVIGCPAEEGAVDDAGGKVNLVKAGVFDHVDCAMMIHPSTLNGSRSTSSAREALEISFYGEAAHAAGGPEHGRNALDGAILTFNGFNALREHVTDDVRIHGIINEGGAAPNIVPEFAQIRMYVRASDVNYLDEVVERVKNCARGAAQQAGVDVKFRKTANRYANLRCNDTLADAYSQNFASLDEEIDDSYRESAGSTDMGNVSQVVPSIHPYVAIAPEEVAGHSTEFCDASADSGGREGMQKGAAALAMTAVECLLDKDLLDNVKREFDCK